MKNKITKEQFTELAKKHLVALKSYKMDKNGNKPIEIFGIEKLYEAIVVMPSACNCTQCNTEINYKGICETCYTELKLNELSN